MFPCKSSHIAWLGTSPHYFISSALVSACLDISGVWNLKRNGMIVQEGGDGSWHPAYTILHWQIVANKHTKLWHYHLARHWASNPRKVRYKLRKFMPGNSSVGNGNFGNTPEPHGYQQSPAQVRKDGNVCLWVTKQVPGMVLVSLSLSLCVVLPFYKAGSEVRGRN